MFKQLLFAHMSGVVAQELKQKAAFASLEQEVLLGLRVAAAGSWSRGKRFSRPTPT
jgi:hypothetical protein